MRAAAFWSFVTLTALTAGPRPTWAEAPESTIGQGSRAHAPAVLLGADGGLAALVGDARSRVGADPGALLRLYGGYRFSGGIEPELSFSQVDFSHIADSHPFIVALAPGCRWWIPLGEAIQPWLGAHLGIDQVQSQSGDVGDVQTYWNIDAGGGVNFVLARHIGLGTGITWTYADILNRPLDQPVPPGYGPAPKASYVLMWLTMQAGLTIIL